MLKSFGLDSRVNLMKKTGTTNSTPLQLNKSEQRSKNMDVKDFLKEYLNSQGQIKNRDLQKIIPKLKSII